MKRLAVYQFLEITWENYANLMYRPRPLQHWKFVKHTPEDIELTTCGVLFVSSSSLWTFRAYVSFIFTYFVFRAFCTSFSCGVLESPSPAVNCRSFSLLLLFIVIVIGCCCYWILPCNGRLPAFCLEHRTYIILRWKAYIAVTMMDLKIFIKSKISYS